MGQASSISDGDVAQFKKNGMPIKAASKRILINIYFTSCLPANITNCFWSPSSHPSRLICDQVSHYSDGSISIMFEWPTLTFAPSSAV